MGKDLLLTVREAARLDMVRKSVDGGDTLERAFLHAVKLSAEALHVTRVGVWLFAKDMQSIRCVVQYDLRSGDVTAGEEIDLARCPEYARALATRRAVPAEDVYSDPRTLELSPYFRQHGISSLLDTPIFQQGEPVALLCHEQVGPGRAWSTTDKHFAASVSDMLGVYLEQHAAQTHYEELLKTRRALEEHRVMESLGRMATAVAHDVNNVLQAVALQAELLGRAPTASERAPLLSELLAIVDQGSRLTRQLLDVGRRDSSDTDITDLAQVVRDMEPLLRTYARAGVQLALRLPAEPAKVSIERARFEQVVMNLAVNARDAMLGGGMLTVEVLLLPSTERDPTARDVRLVVSDTGVGMNEELRERMFEPFFTTKTEEQGHGLGLATVYGIVVSSKGKIEVESQRGAGTRFCLTWAEAG